MDFVEKLTEPLLMVICENYWELGNDRIDTMPTLYQFSRIGITIIMVIMAQWM